MDRAASAEHKLSSLEWSHRLEKMKNERKKVVSRDSLVLLLLKLVQCYNVSRNTVMKVVDTVVSDLRLEVKLPNISRSTLYLKEVAVANLADRHIRSILENNAAPKRIMHDGTQKKGRNYYAVTIEAESKCILTSLQQTGDKTATTTLTSFLTTLKTRWAEARGNERNFAKLIISIVGQVSDQCATEGKFISELIMIKYGMLKEQFPDMSEEELRKMANIIRMACFAHIVGGLSEG